MKYMIQGRDSFGNWAEDVVGNDREGNTFPTRKAAAKMIRELVRIFSGDDVPPTTDDFRVVERN